MIPRKENGAPISLNEYYQQGLITRAEYRRLAPAANHYFISRGLVVHGALFSCLATTLGEEYGFLKVSDSHGSTYRIDPDIMDTKIDDVRRTVQSIKNSYHPQRKVDEITQAQQSLLRVPLSDDSWRTVSFDEAYTLLMDRGVAMFRKWGLIDEAEAMSQDAVIKIFPYLAGERGTFKDLYQFRDKYFGSVLRSIHIDYVRKQRVEQKTIASVSKEMTQTTETEPTNQTSLLFAHARSTDEKRMLEMRLHGLEYHHIARLLGVTVDVIKTRFRTLRNRQKRSL